MKHSLPLLFFCVLPLSAQMTDNQTKELICDEQHNWGNKQVRSCQIKEFPGPSTSALQIDGGENGGVSVKGWNGTDMLVRAKIETWAPSQAEAAGMQTQVHVTVSGGVVSASSPTFGDNRGFSVSYEIFVPHQTDLQAKAHNGGLHLADLRGTIHFDTLNGGVHLARLAGNVDGKTTNGGLHIELEGSRWNGSKLNVETTNGGVHVQIPEKYAAHLETSTVNGNIKFDFPVTVNGKIGKQFAVDLNGGGPTIRAVTVNGGVSLNHT